MPSISGYDLCREIRKVSDVPIIMISAKDEEIDRILGLELGSDDYISKPFSLREISVKVRNMLRRRENIDKMGSADQLFCKDLEILKGKRLVKAGNEILNTTPLEYDLLELLVDNKDRAFSREEIIKKIWKYDYVDDTRQLDHLIKRLRKKLFLAGTEFKILTIWGFGYKVSD